MIIKMLLEVYVIAALLALELTSIAIAIDLKRKYFECSFTIGFIQSVANLELLYVILFLLDVLGWPVTAYFAWTNREEFFNKHDD